MDEFSFESLQSWIVNPTYAKVDKLLKMLENEFDPHLLLLKKHYARNCLIATLKILFKNIILFGNELNEISAIHHHTVGKWAKVKWCPYTLTCHQQVSTTSFFMFQEDSFIYKLARSICSLRYSCVCIVALQNPIIK